MLLVIALFNVQAAGVKLKELVCEESVAFYVSPFVRSKQTYDQLRQCFHDEQVRNYLQEECMIRNVCVFVCFSLR